MMDPETSCGGAHYCGRAVIYLGHEMKLIPPAYVKRLKNDAVDAEDICEAAQQRPNMQFVAIKSEEQQASGLAFWTHDLLARQRTHLITRSEGTSPSMAG